MRSSRPQCSTSFRRCSEERPLADAWEPRRRQRRLGDADGRTTTSSRCPSQVRPAVSRSGTEAYYSFDYANVHFVCLESFETNRSATGPMLTWLQNDLASTAQPWVIAFFHHPPYSKGSHDSDTDIELKEMRQNALPILEDARRRPGALRAQPFLRTLVPDRRPLRHVDHLHVVDEEERRQRTRGRQRAHTGSPPTASPPTRAPSTPWPAARGRQAGDFSTIRPCSSR